MNPDRYLGTDPVLNEYGRLHREARQSIVDELAEKLTQLNTSDLAVKQDYGRGYAQALLDVATSLGLKTRTEFYA